MDCFSTPKVRPRIASGVKTPLTFGASSAQGNLYPIWSPDEKHIAYTSFRNGKYGLYQKSADGSGSETVLLEGTDHFRVPTSWPGPPTEIFSYITKVFPAELMRTAYREA